MAEKKWLAAVGTPLAGARSALDDCSSMLQALGYTLDTYGADATGAKYVLTKGSIRVELIVTDHDAC